MLAVDDTRTASVRLLRAADSGFAIEATISSEDEPPAVHGPVPLAFRTHDDHAVVTWFATHLGEPPLNVYRALTGPIVAGPNHHHLPLPRLHERSVTIEVPAGLVLPLLRVLGPAGASEAAEEDLRLVSDPIQYRSGGERWLPVLHGPGILENTATGERLAYERIRLLDSSSVRGAAAGNRTDWILGARAVELVPVGGPIWTIALEAAPFATGIADGGAPATDGTGVRSRRGVEEQVGSLYLAAPTGQFVCRAVGHQDLSALSRVAPHLPKELTLALNADEARKILADLVRTSGRHRDPSGRLDWNSFRTAVVADERIEALIDEDLWTLEAVRYRRRLGSGDAVLRTLERANHSEARWADASQSLWELARVGWTPEATTTIRPHLTGLFSDRRSSVNPATAVVAAGDHVTKLHDIAVRSPLDYEHILDVLVAMLTELDERIDRLDQEIDETFDTVNSYRADERLIQLMEIDDLIAERNGLTLQRLRWQRWSERGRPDELPITMDELVQLLLAGSLFDEA